jgi:hypothetical protein
MNVMVRSVEKTYATTQRWSKESSFLRNQSDSMTSSRTITSFISVFTSQCSDALTCRNSLIQSLVVMEIPLSSDVFTVAQHLYCRVLRAYGRATFRTAPAEVNVYLSNFILWEQMLTKLTSIRQILYLYNLYLFYKKYMTLVTCILRLYSHVMLTSCYD